MNKLVFLFCVTFIKDSNGGFKPITFHSLVIRKVDGFDYNKLCVKLDEDNNSEICTNSEYGIFEDSWAVAFSDISETKAASPFITFLFSKVSELSIIIYGLKIQSILSKTNFENPSQNTTRSKKTYANIQGRCRS